MRTYALLAAACAALAGLAGTDEAARVIRLRDEALRFNAAAARLAVTDLARDPSYDATRHRAAVEALAARRDWAVAHLNSTNAEGRAEAVALVEGYRAALLANPRLDADQILCVRRHLKNSVWPTNTYGTVGGSDGPPYRKRALSRDLGLLGLNAHNHMDLRRTGFTNEIAVISNLRATPAFTTLYRPPNTSIVRDLDLDFDASRILFTSFRGTNNLLGVFEIALSGPSALSAPTALSVPTELSREATLRGEAPLRAEGPLNHLRGEAPLRAEGPHNHLRGEAPLHHLRGEAQLKN